MIFKEKTITLKNGKTAILKTPEINDAEKMLSYIKTACGETDFLLRYPEEWDGVSLESEEKWISGLRSSKTALAIACYIDGKVVGNCEINFCTVKKMSHRASVHIAIHKDCWSLGIGSAMFRELIDAARAHTGTEIVELDFLEGNDRARALYEKFGFRVVSERPNAFKLKDGRYISEFYMQKYL